MAPPGGGAGARAEERARRAVRNKDAGGRTAIELGSTAFNSDWRELDRLIREQFWRVAFYRVAEDEINYRRFFNINDLAGLRIECGPVSTTSMPASSRCSKAARSTASGSIISTGCSIPKPISRRCGPRATRPFYLVVEKILAAHESLRADWPVEGTTGYDYTNLALGVLVDPAASPPSRRPISSLPEKTRISRPSRATASSGSWKMKWRASSTRSAAAPRNCRGENPMTADLTRALLQRAIKQVVANFPVYRTYLDFAGMPADADRRDIAWAMTRARRSDPDVDPSVFDFLQNTLMAETATADNELQPHRGAPLRDEGAAVFRSRDGQGCRGHRLLSLQSVRRAQRSRRRAGAVRPRRPPSFIKPTPPRPELAARHAWQPRRTTPSAAKTIGRGSPCSPKCRRNGRARSSWSRILRARRGDVERTAPPDRDDEYMLYQMFVGSWPIDMLDAERRADRGLRTPHSGGDREIAARGQAARAGPRPTPTMSRRRRRSRGQR